MNDDVIEYIKNAKTYGMDDAEIEKNLKLSGWNEQIIKESFAYLSGPKSVAPKVEPAVSQPLAASTPMAVNQAAPPSASDPITPVETPKSGRRKWFLLGGIIVLLLLLGSGYAAAEYFGYVPTTILFNQPEKIWNTFLITKQQPIFSTVFTVSYADSGKADGTSPATPTTATLAGNFYFNNSDPNQIEADGNLSYSFGGSGNSITASTPFKIKDHAFFVNLDNNQLLSQFYGGELPGWIKISADSKSVEEVRSLLGEEKDTSPIADLATISDLAKKRVFLGYETINGIKTAHYSVEITAESITEFFKKQIGAQGTDPAEIQNLETTVADILKDLKLSDIELWIGATDYQLYKFHLKSNAPSVSGIMDVASGDAVAKSNDAKRLADVRQIASSLELYFNDHGGYPASNQGVPLNLAPDYLSTLPTAPEPNGRCTDYYNKYWYSAKGSSKKSEKANDASQVFSNYTLTFCLGGKTGGYEAGIGTLSESGITTTATCPVDAPDCLLPESKDVSIPELSQSLQLNATLELTLGYADYGKIKPVEAPADAKTLESILENSLNGIGLNQ